MQGVNVFIFCVLIGVLGVFSISIMFYWEGKTAWWIRLPVINLLAFVVLFIAGMIEEVYLTFHPRERTKYIKTSIFQRFF